MGYVWGGKSVNVPPTLTKSPSPCNYVLTGVDCSGMLHAIAASLGISLPEGTANDQGIETNWIMPPEWRLGMKRVTDGTIQTGDIAVWDGHIGVVERAGSTINVISSLGGKELSDCVKNRGDKRGPRSLRIDQIRLGVLPTHYLRLEVLDKTFSGTFNVTSGGVAENGSTIPFLDSGTFSGSLGSSKWLIVNSKQWGEFRVNEECAPFVSRNCFRFVRTPCGTGCSGQGGDLYINAGYGYNQNNGAVFECQNISWTSGRMAGQEGSESIGAGTDLSPEVAFGSALSDATNLTIATGRGACTIRLHEK